MRRPKKAGKTGARSRVFAALCVLAVASVFPVLFAQGRGAQAPPKARDAALVLARRPFGFLGLAVTLLLVNVIGVAAAILPFLTLTIAYSFLVSAHFALPKNPAREA